MGEVEAAAVVTVRIGMKLVVVVAGPRMAQGVSTAMVLAPAMDLAQTEPLAHSALVEPVATTKKDWAVRAALAAIGVLRVDMGRQDITMVKGMAPEPLAARRLAQ